MIDSSYRSGGYKISALHVERLLLAHPDIKEIAVVGVTDEVYGQKVSAIIVQENETDPINENKVRYKSKNDCLCSLYFTKKTHYILQLKTWGLDKMPKYLIPTKVVLTEELPKNHMGKVNKKELVKKFFPAC